MAPKARVKHQPGRDRNDHESNQARKVGQDAKITYVNAEKKYGPKSMNPSMYSKTTLENGEKKMSISASKYRERNRSKK